MAKDMRVCTCAIRYLFDGPGPELFLVEHGGELRVYCAGMLSDPLSDGMITAMLSDEKRGWIPVCGTLVIETGTDGRLGSPAAMGVDPGAVVVEMA